ncbi:MAG TPA: hypothetical protein DCP06_07135 [Lachnospiraceae bacterium]|nr:hypothetical protein [Lachnospiraceae bacterium]
MHRTEVDMFGYVVVNKPELKIREFTDYNAYYCGLCHMLRDKFGLSAGLTLTYDMTFLILLLDSLYEPRYESKQRHCPIHPVKKKPMIKNEITEYAADMNMLLSWGHLKDDWEDEKKLVGLIGDIGFKRRAEYVMKRYRRQTGVVLGSLASLQAIEKKYMSEWSSIESEFEGKLHPDTDQISYTEADIDEISQPFGDLMGEIFVMREDAFAPTLRGFGSMLGKYIYIKDALEDIEKDRKKGCFNPFLHISKDDDRMELIKNIQEINIRQAISEFEKLPLERHLPILRNILYEGVRADGKPKNAKP